MSFDSLGLTADLLRAVAAQGYTQPTPIQQQAIPAVLAGRDVLAGAQTGTGKTAAFTLPMLQLLEQNSTPNGRRRLPRALILTPTRELAAQVGESVHAYGAHTPLKSVQIFGGVGMNPQISALRQGVDIVVATPGRLLDHAGQRNIDLSAVEILVLDEADRMLDMGFIHPIRQILRLLPAKRQNLMFSATYSREIEQLARGFLKDPVRIEVTPRNTVAQTVAHVVHPVAQSRKRELLAQLIHNGGWEQVLVFTRTKHGANRLVQQLERDGITAAAIHGNKSQNARTRALADFKNGAVRTLVATDIAARGIDIHGLSHVVNFELPNVPEDYVHRIGRTGRAGATGMAVSLVSGPEKSLLHGIEKLLGHKIEQRLVEGFEDNGPAESEEPMVEPRSQRPRRGNAPKGKRPAADAGKHAQRARSHERKPEQPRAATGNANRPGGRSRRKPGNGGNAQQRRSGE